MKPSKQRKMLRAIQHNKVLKRQEIARISDHQDRVSNAYDWDKAWKKMDRKMRANNPWGWHH